MEEIVIDGHLIEIDKECAEMVKYFNRIGLKTRFCCSGHGKGVFDIIFDESVTDDIVLNMLSQYETVHGHSPFLGKFVKWHRKLSGKVVANWMYYAESIEDADITLKRLKSDEYKINVKNGD